MRWLLDIARGAGEGARRQVFSYESDDATATVASALREINARSPITDAEGNEALPIRWECSCLQRKCGACAMLVNGAPALACDVRLAEAGGQRVRLDPLSAFPVVTDLVVDRSPALNRLTELGVWLEREVGLPVRRGDVAYEATRCLQCGCCLEVCPNFFAGGEFGGMSAMVPLARLLAEAGPEERGRLAAAFREGVHGGCGKSLACRDVCPAGIDIARLMSRSTAAAVWRRW